jgi:uncharacterized membrane protein YhaH (DUF805 family)
MTFFESVRSVLTKYATFSGRACRSEYWWFVLFYALVSLVAVPLDRFLGTAAGEVGFFDLVSRIALTVPFIAVGVRRLHDVGWSGWWLLTIVPSTVLAFMKGNDGPNDYGPNPLGEV